jgi:hypothetical protein
MKSYIIKIMARNFCSAQARFSSAPDHPQPGAADTLEG